MSRYSKMFTRRSNGLFEATYQRDGKRKHLYDRDPERLFRRLTAETGTRIITLRDLAESWEAQHREEVGARTWNNYAPHLSRILCKHGDMLVEEITAADITGDILAAKAMRYSHTICRTILSIWTMMMNHAVVMGVVKFNPAREVKLPRGLPHKKRTAPDDETVQKIFDSVDRPFGLFPLLLICTGLRKGEALALTWEDVDLARGIITVNKALEYPDGNRPAVKTPKTEAGIRTVPIPDALRERLTPGEGIIFRQSEYNGHPGGGYMSARAYETAWGNYCRDVGITCTAHQLRHGTATLMFEAGVSEKTAQRILGHASPQTTRDIYTDLREAHERAEADALNRALSYRYDIKR